MRITEHCRCNQDGFTLVEVMLAVVILSVALVPLLDLFYTASLSNKRAGENTITCSLGQALAEELMAEDYGDLDPGIYAPQVYPDSDFCNYTYEKEITYYDAEKYAQHVKKLVIRVYPTANPTHKTELTFLLSEKR